jgi:hypothetical protein
MTEQRVKARSDSDKAWMSDYLAKTEGAGQEWHERIQAISDYIKESQQENEKLQGLLTQRANEISRLQGALDDAHDRLRCSEEQWIRDSNATPDGVGFRRKAIEHIQQLQGQITDLKQQVEAERSARVWHMKSETDAQKDAWAMGEKSRTILEEAERKRKISLNRLQRAKRAEAALVTANERRKDEKARADYAEAMVSHQNRKFEEKVKTIEEQASLRWQMAVDTWRQRYEDAIRKIDRLERSELATGE